MKVGTLSPNILKRSVYNQINYRSGQQIIVPSMGEPCGGARIVENSVITVTSLAYGSNKDLGIYPIARVINDIKAKGGEPLGVHITIQFSTQAYESRLKAMVGYIEAFCKTQQVPILGIQASVTNCIRTTNVFISGIGSASQETIELEQLNAQGMDVVLLGEVGLEGVLQAIQLKEDELSKRFIKGFLQPLQNREKDLVANKAMDIAKANKVIHIHQIPATGILGGLWELGERTKVGIEIKLRNLTIAQETIEVCEFLGINPYRLSSAGSFLMLVENGERLVEKLKEAGYKAVIIGCTTSDKEKILCNGEDIRHLEWPATNELCNILEEEQEVLC